MTPTHPHRMHTTHHWTTPMALPPEPTCSFKILQFCRSKSATAPNTTAAATDRCLRVQASPRLANQAGRGGLVVLWSKSQSLALPARDHNLRLFHRSPRHQVVQPGHRPQDNDIPRSRLSCRTCTDTACAVRT